jgi:hypothetical protein
MSDPIDVGGDYADKSNRDAVEYQNKHLEKYTPADSATYLDGSLPRYQDGSQIGAAGAAPDEAPTDINNEMNPMDPSPGAM